MKHLLVSKSPAEARQKIQLPTKKQKVLVISGPTATGKTKLSLSLAQAVGGEIISADSCQVYRGMDIGTAKASLQERSLITHHLIDILEISQSFNVVDFYQRTQSVLQGVIARDNLPIIVGGSGFYVHVLLYGPPMGPTSVPSVRKQLEHQLKNLGAEVLYERLQILDPEYAATISEKDRHKIVRALEIMALSDRKVSDFAPSNQLKEEHYDFRCWFLYYPRETLYKRIEERCDDMLKQGFLEEVKQLEKQGLRQNLSASQAIGYRQVLEFLDGPGTAEDYQLFVSKFKKASRHFAKRQFTWFRKEPVFRWVNLEEHPVEHIKELILQDLERNDTV